MFARKKKLKWNKLEDFLKLIAYDMRLSYKRAMEKIKNGGTIGDV